METHLASWLQGTDDGELAESILRKCVHCGFCTATCPTYQLLGDELDGPRGRIYLIKQVVEGQEVTEKTRTHLDRCLTCRNCETTCPSGVEYGRLIDLGRRLVEERVPRSSLTDRAQRWTLREGLTSPLFAPALQLGMSVKGLLPTSLQNKVPVTRPAGPLPTTQHTRQVLMLAGCVQPTMAPSINPATQRVLDRLGIQTLIATRAGCCGAIRHHLNDHDGALGDLRRNIDAWWPYVELGVEAIISNASGCGVMLKDYAHLLARDPQYADKAQKISELAVDLIEFLGPLSAELRQHFKPPTATRISFHPPCTLQHGQKLKGAVEALLQQLGVPLQPFAESHLCCGSAGTYSVLQPELAYQLRDRKLAHLQAQTPALILSANIGCITHLQSGTPTPVHHWIEFIDAHVK